MDISSDLKYSIYSSPQVANPSEAQIAFHNIGYNDIATADGTHRPLYLQMQLHTSMLDISSGAHLEVVVSGDPDAVVGGDGAALSMSLQCSLQSSVCSAEPVTCFSDVDVSHLLGSEQGGSLYISPKMNDGKVIGAYTPCKYLGVRNVEYIVSARLTSTPIAVLNPPTLNPSLSPKEIPTGLSFNSHVLFTWYISFLVLYSCVLFS